VARRVLAHLGLVAFGTTVGLALLVAVELVLRALDVAPDARMFAPAVAADGTAVWRLAWNPQFNKPQPVQPLREFSAVKPPGTFRIFVVGESSAEGAPYGTEFAFGGWLQRRLTAQATGVRWEVVNAALSGAQSWSLLAMVRDIARHAPDLLIVYLGHNEVGTRFSAAQRRALAERSPSLVERVAETRLYRLLSPWLPTSLVPRRLDLSRVHRAGESFAVLPPGGTRVYASAADRAISMQAYRARLEDMVDLVHDAGGQAMLLTLSQNFADWPPAASLHRPGVSPDEKVAWRAAVREGDAVAVRDCDAAIAAWTRALALDAEYAAVQFRIARCEHALGRLEAARIHFRRASDLDRLPQGASTTLNDVLRDVARRKGALLVDVDAVLTQVSGPHLVGDDLFVDSIHPNIRAHQLIALAVANAIRDSSLAGPAVRWDNDAYVEPAREAILAGRPDLVTMELASRALACHAAGRTDCSLQMLQAAARQTPDPATRRMLEDALRTAH
jgi:lysophospholipase L1-like esterase